MPYLLKVSPAKKAVFRALDSQKLSLRLAKKVLD